ncbi:MAG: hypothetical protein HFJ60_08915 [Clostridia bacterium]|nr:hypothetical protein [Clostridia bacterium]
MTGSFGGTVKLTGESEYRKALKEISNNLKLLSSEMKLTASQYDLNDKSINNLTSQNEILNKKITEQKNKVDVLTKALSEAKNETNEDSETTKKWQYELNSAQTELNLLNKELKNNSEELKNAKKENEQFSNTNKTTINSFRSFTSELLKTVGGTSNLGQTIKNDLNIRMTELKEKVSTNIDNVKKFGSSIADAVQHPTKLGKAIKEKLVDTAEKLENSTKKNTDSIKDFENAEKSASNETLKFGDILKANILGNVITSGLKAVGTAVKEIASKMGELGKSVLDARGEIEQQIGGIETLFKDNSDAVIKNASNAYKTAGLSATEYMQTATSFSASLLQSLNGDTAKVAEVTDMAIIDMSDNANKMGTSMESIQNAYQGFAKQNYTMLDNLKLGYGGTKTEMQRLLSDAQKVTGIKYDINNLNDVYQAIHVIQGELDITGTTAKEATETLQGSMSGMQGAWQNFLSGSGSLSQVSDAVTNVVKNVTRIAKEAIPQILGDIKSSLPQLLEVGKDALMTIVNGIQQYLPELLNVAIDIINSLLSDLIEVAPTLIQAGIEGIAQLINGLGQALPELIPKALEAIITLAEGLLDNIDMIIDAGIQLIIGLADGLIQSLPNLIEKIPVIIDKLINALTNNLPKILEAGIKLIIKLAEGLIKAIPQLISKIPQIITSLVNGFKNYWSNMGEIGKNIVEGIWNGIKNAKDWLLRKVKEWCGNIVSGIKGFFGIHSPSTLFRDEVGKFMAQGVGVGFSNEMTDVTKQMQNAIPAELDTNLKMNTSFENIDRNTINYNELTNSFITALKTMKIELDDEVAGRFVVKTITREVYV